MSVSSVVRVISAVRLTTLHSPDAGLHRLGVHAEALGARDRRARRRASGAGGVADADLGHAAPERPRRQRRREARGAAGRQRVVRAGDVVAEGATAPTNTQPAQRTAGRAGLGGVADQREVLGREAVGDGAALLQRRDASTRPATAPVSARLGQQRLDAVEQRRVVGDQRDDASRRRARPGPAGRAPPARGRRRRRPRPAGRWARRKPSMPTSPATSRLASWHVEGAGAGDHVDARGPTRSRRPAPPRRGRRPSRRPRRRRSSAQAPRIDLVGARARRRRSPRRRPPAR